MRSLFGPSLVILLAIGLTQAASAQDSSAGKPPSNAATPPSDTTTTLTGKERLGRKWFDEQRIDNCKVPIEQRGTRPRSSTCPHVPMG